MCLVTGCPTNALPSRLLPKFCSKHSARTKKEESGVKRKGNKASDDVKQERKDDAYDVEEALSVVKFEDESSSSEENDIAPVKKVNSIRHGKTVRTTKQSSEKRKEKSRDAARSRRGKESELYSSLSECLPLPEDVLANLDKASIMRLAIACLRTDDMMHNGLAAPSSTDGAEEDAAMAQRVLDTAESSPADAFQDGLLQALDGFILVLSSSGDVAFVSATIATYLGLQQVDVMGASLYDLVHQCDHEELRHLLTVSSSGQGSSSNGSSGGQASSSNGSSTAGGRKHAASRSSSTCPPTSRKASQRRSKSSCAGDADSKPSAPRAVAAPDYCEARHGFLRMKCTLANRGRNVTIRNASYKVVEVSGKMVWRRSSNNNSSDVADRGWLVCVAAPVPHPANIEVPLDTQTYFSKHSLDMKFTYADENFPQFCGFSPSQLEGRSFFQLHHELDGPLLRQSFVTLRSKGQVSTGQYRFLAAGGGYVWLVTQATVIYAHRDSAPSAVVCLHYVISGVEEPHSVVSCVQLLARQSPPPPLTGSGCVGFCVSSAAPSAGRSSSQSAKGSHFTPQNNNCLNKNNTQQKTTGGNQSNNSGSVLALAPDLLTTVLPATPSAAAPPVQPQPAPAATTLAIDLIDTKPFDDSPNIIPSIKIDQTFVVVRDTVQYRESTVSVSCTAPENVLNINTTTDSDDLLAASEGVNHLTTPPYRATSPGISHAASQSLLSPQDTDWSCGRSRDASPGPLLTQAAQDLPSQSLFTSSTESLFQKSECPTLDEEGGLNLEKYLFSDSDAYGGSSTCDLFADCDLSELNLISDSNLNDNMEMIDGATLFKNEPFNDGEEFDARAPFLPLCDVESLFMWNPLLELEDSGSSHSAASSGANTTAPNTPDDSIYGPDGVIRSLHTPLTDKSSPRLKEEEECGPMSSLLAELLQSIKDAPLDPVPVNSCIDPNRVWPGHKPANDVTIKDNNMFELENFLRDEEVTDYQFPYKSPTLGSASLNSVPASYSSCTASPLAYSTSLSPAFACLASSSSPPCNTPPRPEAPQHPVATTTKRPNSPLQNNQMPRKRLCSPHVEKPQPRTVKQMSPQFSSNCTSAAEPRFTRSGRKLETPNAPYMQHLLNTSSSDVARGHRMVYSDSAPRLVAQTVAVVPRVQMTRPRVYRVVRPRDHLPQSRHVLVHAHDDQRTLKPVRLLSERNVVEYVCSEDEPHQLLDPPMNNNTQPLMSDDSYDWVEVIDEGGIAPTKDQFHLNTNLNSRNRVQQHPTSGISTAFEFINGFQDMSGEPPPVSASPNKCLQYSPVTMLQWPDTPMTRPPEVSSPANIS